MPLRRCIQCNRWAVDNGSRCVGHTRMRTRAKWAPHHGQLADDFASKLADRHFKCVYCGGPWAVRDHVLPLSRGGTSRIENLEPACWRCNQKKRELTPEEWQGRSISEFIAELDAVASDDR